MGVPVIATNVRGCRQVVDHGTTGVLVPPRDAEALAAAISALAKDPDRRARFAIAGAAKATREFDERRCIDITLATYRRLLERRASSVAARTS